MRALVMSLLVVLAGCSGGDEEADAAEVGDEQELAAAAAHPLGPEPSGKGTRYPIVLVHGFTGSRTLWNFVDVPEALRRDGHGGTKGPAEARVFHAELPPFGRPDDNAIVLSKQIDDVLARTGATRVNLIAHSKGGLDARAFVSLHNDDDRVASLTTIASPHHGTRVADAALGLIDGTRSDSAIDHLLTLWTLSLSRDEFIGREDIRGALSDMAERNADAWNAAHPDDPRVLYQSWAGVSFVGGLPHPKGSDFIWQACQQKGYVRVAGQDVPRDRMDLKLVPGASLVAHGTALLPNDGLSLVSSSMWGQFRGCIPADHQDDVGRPGQSGADSRSGFQHVRFYRQIAFELAARGLLRPCRGRWRERRRGRARRRRG